MSLKPRHCRKPLRPVPHQTTACSDALRRRRKRRTRKRMKTVTIGSID